MSNKDYAEDWEYESGVMGGNAKELGEAVIGHRIVSAERGNSRNEWGGNTLGVTLTLDDGTEVFVADTDDCCAYTQVDSLEFLEGTDNAITRVETNEDFTTWHIYADQIPVVTLGVEWSPGNPYYYGFGFDIVIKNKKEDA